MWKLADTHALLFDLDGTLVDTAADFVTVLNAQRRRHQLSELDPQIIRDTVSDGARALTKLAFGGNEGEAGFEAKREELLELYADQVGLQARLFEGMDEVLAYLEAAAVPWGIVTNKPRRFTIPLLEQLNLNQRSSVTLCPDDVTRSKPDPESLLLASSRLNTLADQTIYVGDHERDIIAGKAAGMPTIAAAYGYLMAPDAAHQWGADQVINHPAELIKLLS